MPRHTVFAALALLLLVVPARSQTHFSFRDVGREVGLLPAAGGIAGHAAAWGDIDGSGYPALYVGTFGAKPYGSKNNLLFRNLKGKLVLDDQKQLQICGRGNGAVFVDLDNDGDLDLYYTNHAIQWKPYGAGNEHFSTPNALFRNDGQGKFSDVSQDSGACPMDFPSRSVAALDFNGDGRLDLLVGECFFQGGQSRSRLFQNLGNFKFADVTTKVGLPEKVTGFGVAAADVDNDGWPDIFLAGRFHGNRLFRNDKGRFQEVPKTHADFTWKYHDTQEDTSCGVCFGDLNRDGLLDLVIGTHPDRPWVYGGVRPRLYLNRGVADGWPRFEDVTEKAGLTPQSMKAPHVELRDFDNDGWPDLYVSIVKFAGAKTYPVLYRHLGVQNGLPRFEEDAAAVNDFPTAADKKIVDVTKFFEQMKKEGKIVYMASAPSADFDRDGRLDLFLANWWVDKDSLLLRNETKSGNWLAVDVRGGKSGNRQGIGARVHVYEAGKLGRKDALLSATEIAVGYGYASGQEAAAHIGLGTRTTCDVEVILPHGQGRVTKSDVQANQRLTIAP
ncbi:MAG: CRTAC1 family protein [Gemmataceae bacterium]|nr:CRTAC1 family protein [Gemmataceae bacterium]